MSASLLIFGWHNVEPSWFFPAPPGAGARGMVEQLRFLKRFAHVVPLDEALDALAEGRPLPRRAVALTFDDGYRDNLDVAVPILESLCLPATFFLVPHLLSRMVRPWWEVLAWTFARSTLSTLSWDSYELRLDEASSRSASSQFVTECLKQRNGSERQVALEELTALLDPSGDPEWERLFLDWDEARTLVQRNFAIGSHSLTHPILSRECDDDQRRELGLSRDALRGELGGPVDIVAYPNGTPEDYSTTTIAATQAAGYRFGITTNDGWNGPETRPFEVRRFVVAPEHGVSGLRFGARRDRRGRTLSGAAALTNLAK